MKKNWGLMSVFSGYVKIRNGQVCDISMIKQGDLLAFPTKRDANKFISDHCAWALMPILIWENVSYSKQYYQFAYDHPKFKK